jgi:hypothetical protein
VNGAIASELPATTVGLDVSDRQSHFCIADAAGTVVEEGRVATTPAALERRFGAMAACRIVLEVGTHSPWIDRLLRTLGHAVPM